MSCLVVGYDRGEASRRAVSWAASQLAPQGKLVLVHACRPLHTPPSPLSSERERHEFGRALFDELLLEGEDALLDTIVHTELSDADPVSALTSAAAKHSADGIVVGHEPHSRLHTAVGTVTGTLLSRANVPVTVVPADAAAEC
jgi:nucleotide-binding universal stress UspA family protein